MPDYVPIQDLTIVGSIGDNDLFPLSDSSGAYAVKGSTIKSYAASDAASAAADAALAKAAAEAAAADAEAVAADAEAGADALANEASTFSATTAYPAGSYVLYNNALYRFTIDHAAGAWNVEHVALVKLGPDMQKYNDLLTVGFEYALTWGNGGISSTSGGNTTDTTRIRTPNYIPIVGLKGIKLTVPAGYWCGVYYYEGQSYETFKSDYTVVGAGERIISNLPDGYNFVRLICSKSPAEAIDYTQAPNIGFVIYGITDKTLTLRDKAADSKAVGEALADVEAQISDVENLLAVEYEPVLTWEQGGISSSSGGNTTDTTRIRTGYISIDNKKGYTIIVPANYFCVAYYYEAQGYQSYQGIYKVIAPGETTESELSDGCNFVRLICSKSATEAFTPDQAPEIDLTIHNVTDKTLTLRNKAADAYAVGTELNKKADISFVEGIVETIAQTGTSESWGIANALASAKQICDIPWTPVGNMPRTNTNSVYPDPVQYFSISQHRGIPYSSVRDQDKAVGMDVSIHTFMTAVHDPRSVLYTRRSTVSNSATYYGTVCSGLVNYALGIGLDLTNVFLAGWDAFDTIPMQSIQPADMIWVDGHAALVSNITKDEYGRISGVTIMEEWRALPRTVVYNSWQEFMEDRAGYIARRFKHIAGIPYTPIPYLPLFDETPEDIVYPDIQTEFGDAAVFMAGEDVKVNVIDAKDYVNIIVKRGTTTVLETSTIEDFTLQDVTAGLYTITAHGGMYDSESTFYVVDASASFDTSTGEVTFSSSNATPVMVGVYQIAMTSGGKRDVGVKNIILTPEETEAGHINVLSYMSENHQYAKVWFRTDYGTAVWYSETHDKWVPIGS